AKALFVQQYDALHVELESPGFPQRLRPAWGKLEAYLARFALILAMTRIAELEEMGGGPREEVAREDMEGAARLLAYFKNHARRVFTGLYGDSASDNLAADLRDFLIEHGGRWEGSAKELQESLVSDHKPERPADFSKVIRAISKRSPLLEFEELPRTPAGYRPFRLTLRIADIADIADTTPEEEEVKGTL
ncbi:MAG: YfjI family protein, partial [Actinomycetota bacterium]|nr:YfjI family protein [Actinomycetota bacterium]